MQKSGRDQNSPVQNSSLARVGRPTLSDSDWQRELERERLGRQGAEAEACRSLWIAVIRQAVRDLLWLQEKGFSWDEADSQKHQEILLYNPVAFLSDKQFDEICRRIDLEPALVRDLLDIDQALCRSAAA